MPMQEKDGSVAEQDAAKGEPSGPADRDASTIDIDAAIQNPGSAGMGGGAGTGGGTGTTSSNMLHVEGRYLYDTCGNKVLIRGFEQVIGLGIDVGGSWDNLIDEVAKTGANAMRILPDDNLSAEQVESVIKRIVSHGMVFNISRGGETWFQDAALKAVLQKYKSSMILDAFHEPNYDDRARWVSDVKSSIAAARAAGYDGPLNVIANHYGRDLPSVLDNGADILAADPMHQIVFGWQAYWGSNNGSLGADYGMNVVEGAGNAAQKGFVVQLGLDYLTDPSIDASLKLDYAAMMQAAVTNEQGWLWWDWYNPFGNANSASKDGTAGNLTAFGNEVVNTSPAAIKKVAKLACAPQQ